MPAPPTCMIHVKNLILRREVTSLLRPIIKIENSLSSPEQLRKMTKLRVYINKILDGNIIQMNKKGKAYQFNQSDFSTERTLHSRRNVCTCLLSLLTSQWVGPLPLPRPRPLQQGMVSCFDTNLRSVSCQLVTPWRERRPNE